MENNIGKRCIIWLILLVTVAFPYFLYKFKHPKKTETQLTIDFLRGKTYSQFFNEGSH